MATREDQSDRPANLEAGQAHLEPTHEQVLRCVISSCVNSMAEVYYVNQVQIVILVLDKKC
jgi:hypothetical protein